MNRTRPNDTAAPIACAVDKSCGPDTGCGCNPPATAGRRRGLKAAVLGVLCVVGCLAVPIAIGGFAALGGALTGEVWLLVAGLVVAAVIAIIMKRRGSGSIC
ncbi:MAG: MerC domain-containing protein [Actinobacteria bacterium]|nr:MerC domain-containing protein [Actinomycetota bacterium]